MKKLLLILLLCCLFVGFGVSALSDEDRLHGVVGAKMDSEVGWSMEVELRINPLPLPVFRVFDIWVIVGFDIDFGRQDTLTAGGMATFDTIDEKLRLYFRYDSNWVQKIPFSDYNRSDVISFGVIF